MAEEWGSLQELCNSNYSSAVDYYPYEYGLLKLSFYNPESPI